ncbi:MULTISPECIES: paraquat-inducible protein A [Oleiagrimonas]|jgi:paraquat-inducible protein A|uniref:Paraquat-inducible membrane protein A n=1 Tax=Oleiagrimonas citrea TaxID=1665687 RepID=A0A846ZIZ1_9GAMM|nr:MULTISPECIES: paraquat-inducible protein A [Oleiagrimonas]NKZ37966.1 paraquat-inducible membrane protein A [Oleiagrimonas citrea]RAP57456.1 paraquat-inducible membrane protein A [Oleiagrimonas sp. MCCC 1A03011]
MSEAHIPTAGELGIIACHCCGQLCQHVHGDICCARCGARLHRRKPNSLARCWALLIAAMILYIPANVLPIMLTGSLFGKESNTILSGVAELWRAGSWDLAVIVFVASIMVPLLKFAALLVLLISVQRRKAWRTRGRAHLFRLVEGIGYWSMLDVFVVTLLVALVRFQLTQVDPGPGVVYFGLVVVLTMLASMSFDPRLIWDHAVTEDEKKSQEAEHDRA